MKITPIALAHEIAQEYGLPCCVCGKAWSESQHMHHEPKRRHNMTDILYSTIFPVCYECHVTIHNGNIDVRGIMREYFPLYFGTMNHHIDMIKARC